MSGCETGECEIAKPEAKKVHGAVDPIWRRLGLLERPPVECSLRVGDHVTYRNDYGVEFDQEICGFSDGYMFETYGKFIHHCCRGGNIAGCAWWSASHPDALRKA